MKQSPNQPGTHWDSGDREDKAKEGATQQLDVIFKKRSLTFLIQAQKTNFPSNTNHIPHKPPALSPQAANVTNTNI